MTRFAYEAATYDGERVAGRLEATSQAEARRELQHRGLYPLRVSDGNEKGRLQAAVRGSGAVDRLRRHRFGESLGLRFARLLDTFLGAGFSLEESLRMCVDETHDPELAAIAATLRERVREGEPFSRALADHPHGFSALYVSLLRAGEEAGALPAAVERLVSLLERRHELAGRVRSALIYPALMTAVGGLAVLVLVLVVIPKFQTILEGAGQSFPVSTRAVIGASEVVVGGWWAFLLAGVLALEGFRRYRARPRGRRILDAWDLRLPLWGSFRRAWFCALACRTLGTLIRGGLPLPAALDITSEGMSNSVVRSALRDIGEKVRRGGRLGAALAEARVFPSLAVEMLRGGERSGELPGMLDRAAEIHDEIVTRTTDRLVALLEPALILLFGAAVGFVALAMLEAVFRINELPL